MNEAKILSEEAINDLLLVADGLPHGPTLDEIRGQLHAASLASVFILSRKAQSSEVRCEAAKIVDARLHEDDNGPEPPAFDAVSQGELPPKLATHRHFYKFCEDHQWVLTTRSGVRIGVFPSEAELDRWWLGLEENSPGGFSAGNEGSRYPRHEWPAPSLAETTDTAPVLPHFPPDFTK